MTTLTDLAEQLGGPISPVRGRTLARVMRALAQQPAEGAHRDLVQTLDVSAATISKAVAKLKETGLVQQNASGGRTRGPGRPIRPLSWTANFAMIGITVLDRTTEWPGTAETSQLFGTVIGLDGTVVPVDFRRQVDLSEQARTEPEPFVEALARYIEELAAAAALVSMHVLGCGITLGGHVDHGRMRKSYNTLGGAPPDRWAARDGLELEVVLRKRLRMTVVLENDTTGLAVRANLRSQPYDRPARNYLVVAVLDEGVGGGLVIGDTVRRGVHGMAAEPGHMPARHVSQIEFTTKPSPELPLSAVEWGYLKPAQLESADADLDLPMCRCGQEGHVEAFAAPRAIIERAKNLGLAPRRLESIDELAARANTDTRLARMFLQGGLALGTTIATAVNWIDPERVLIYLPEALNENNEFLAGSLYRLGMEREIKSSAFSAGRDTPRRIIASTASRMEERLAEAAAYLVFEKLATATEEVGRKPRAAGADGGAELAVG